MEMAISSKKEEGEAEGKSLNRLPKSNRYGRSPRGIVDKSAEMQKDRGDETDAISGRPW